MDNKGGARHFHELDSLRGLAAVTVLLGHYSNLFLVDRGPYAGVRPLVETARRTPLFVLMAGHEAVMFFFVLSGFVLSLQFLKPDLPSYLPFAIKRLFRIYVPYLAIVLLAIAACGLFYRGPNPDLGPWFNHPWSTPITLRSVFDHVVFLFDFKSDQYDPVLWSLVHELRLSLAFPLLMLLFLRLDWRKNLALSVLLTIGGIAAALAWKRVSGNDSDTGYPRTFEYAGVFILGALLAREREAAVAWYRSWSRPIRAAIALTGFCLYCFGHLAPGKLTNFKDLPIAWGAALLVLVALGSGRTSAFLHLRPIRFLGRVSYSLYLWHVIILLSLVHLLYGKLPLPLILGSSFALSLLVSHLSYVWIEAPAMSAGRRVARRVERSSRPEQTREVEMQPPEVLEAPRAG